MVTADEVRAVGLALPRAYERMVRGRWKLRVGQIVFAAFNKDETDMGFGFPKAERDGLIESDPDTFFLPPTSDLRYQWVCAHLDRLDHEEMREFVTEAWRMCTPKMLHELPEQPAPTAAAWTAMDAGEWGSCGRCSTPMCTGRTATSRCAAGATCCATCSRSRHRSLRPTSRSVPRRSTVGADEAAGQALSRSPI